MRLTLRTLLAYLDDRLSPANAREIGQKITTSPFATELVERIRDVKRKRRLASPAKPQAMIDANLVAEYLDDQLTPELVARVEREILASDPMLAEVAAAHEILGLIQDPVHVEPRLLDRLYGLDPTGNMDVLRALGAQSLSARSTKSESPQWAPLASRVTSSRRLPAMIAALLALVWLAVVASDSELFGPNPIPVAPSEQEGANGVADSGVDAMVADANPLANGDAAANEIAANTTPAEASSSATDSEVETAKSTPADTGIAVPGDVVVITVPDGNDVASANKTTLPDLAAPDNDKGRPDNSKAATDAAAAGNAAVDVEATVYYLQADGRIVLAFDEQQNRWIELAQIPGGEAVEAVQNVVNCSPLLGKKWFGVPQQFHAGIATDSAGWNVRLIGPALVRLRDPILVGDTTASGLDLLSGRMYLSVDQSIALNADQLATFVLGTGSQNSVITLQTEDTRVAIEVIPTAAPADSPQLGDIVEPIVSNLPLDADLHVQVNVLEGSAGLTSPGSEEETLLTMGQRASWTILNMKEFSSLLVDNGVPIAAAPAWLFENNAAEVPEQVILKNRLLDSLGTPNDPGDSVLPLLEDRNPQTGVMAVQLLSLTRDTDRLLSVLFDTLDESIHRSAIDGLSVIANSSHVGREAIRKGLETRLPMAEIDPTAQLILGITEAQATDPRVAEDLMALLSNDRLSTRTLAIYRMEQFTKDRMGYHPDAEASRRREGIRRWQKYLDRNSGRLVPEP